MQIDVSKLSVAQLSQLASDVVCEMAKRAGGFEAAPPYQMSFLTEPAAIDPREVNLDERLPSDKKRWLRAKEAAAELRCSADTLIRQAEKIGSGFQPGGEGTTWYIYMTRYAGRY